jgi:hypothetical protein
MPCLSLPYNPQVGVLLQLVIFPPGFTPSPAGAPPVKASPFLALIDTGASCTCITQMVINAVGLTPMGKQTVGGVHGSKAVNQYQFTVFIPFGQGQASPTGAVSLQTAPFPWLASSSSRTQILMCYWGAIFSAEAHFPCRLTGMPCSASKRAISQA